MQQRSARQSSGRFVKCLVELHQGTITAYSSGAAEGSRFTVCLPLVAKPAELKSQEREVLDHGTAKKLRLMIVDDNPDAAYMLAMYLETAGYNVIVEHDSRRAIERARIERPDVYLLDIGLPHIDGNELARRLRALPEAAKSLLIAVSGYGQVHDRKQSAAAGFDHHFVKPVETTKLASLLAQYGTTLV